MGRRGSESSSRSAAGGGCGSSGRTAWAWSTRTQSVALNGTFATIAPEAGSVGFLSQSGAVGLAVMSETRRRDIGLSSFVSVGNKADISGNDMLSYWEDDAAYQRHPPLPGVLREPAALLASRSPDRQAQADRRREERPYPGGAACRGIAYRITRGHVRPHGRRAVPGERSDPHRHARRDVRRGHAARHTAARPRAIAWGS